MQIYPGDSPLDGWLKSMADRNPWSGSQALKDREDIGYWVEADSKTALRIFQLVEGIMGDPFQGIGGIYQINKGN